MDDQHFDNKSITLKVLGCRGSMAVSGKQYEGFGCATSCYLYMTDTQAVILDAGNGILNIPDLGERQVSVLITHSHIDHILGLPPFLASFGAKEISIYGAVHGGLTIRRQLDTYFQRPLWPIGFDHCPCKINWFDVKEDGSVFYIGRKDDNGDTDPDQGTIAVSAIPSNHPGGSTIYRLEYGGRSFVYATDFEHEELPEDRKDKSTQSMLSGGESSFLRNMFTKPLDTLCAFSKNADLMLFDAQYTPEEYKACKSFGHSTAQKAAELMRDADIGQMILVHHAPGHTDSFLEGMEKDIREKYGCSQDKMRLAREGDVIKIR